MRRRNDLLLIAGLLLAAAVLWLLARPGEAGSWVVVTVDGAETARYPLGEDRTVTIGGEDFNVLRIAHGEAAVTESNCPDHTCAGMGPVSRTGETIVCLPHRLVIRVEGGGAAEFDGRTG